MGAPQFPDKGAAAVGTGFLVRIAVYGQGIIVALSQLVVQNFDSRDEQRDGRQEEDRTDGE